MLINSNKVRNVFLWASALVVGLIPIEAVAVYWMPTGPSGDYPKTVAASALSAADPQGLLASYDRWAQGSALFGAVKVPAVLAGSVPGAGSLARQASFALKGIFSLNGRTAIFEDGQTKKSIFAGSGERIGNWTVEEVLEDSVRMSDGTSESVWRIAEGA